MTGKQCFSLFFKTCTVEPPRFAHVQTTASCEKVARQKTSVRPIWEKLQASLLTLRDRDDLSTKDTKCFNPMLIL